jgi:hypothetical protein
MAQRTVTVLEAHEYETNLFLVYRDSEQEGDVQIGHAITHVTYGYRAVSDGYDPSDPDFHQQVTEQVIREALLPSPEQPQQSQLRGLAVSEASFAVVWEPDTLEVVQAALPAPERLVSALLAADRSARGA